MHVQNTVGRLGALEELMCFGEYRIVEAHEVMHEVTHVKQSL